jgi:hypothetical protein
VQLYEPFLNVSPYSHQFNDRQDQTVKVAEARDLELGLQRLRDENAELRKRVGELSSVETAKKKVEARVEQLEQKVSSLFPCT